MGKSEVISKLNSNKSSNRNLKEKKVSIDIRVKKLEESDIDDLVSPDAIKIKNLSKAKSVFE